MLALLGDRDAFVPVTDLWALALAYGAETELMRGVAHGLPIDPHWKSLAWRINAWIDERRLAAPADRRGSASRLNRRPGRNRSSERHNGRQIVTQRPAAA